MKNHEEKPWRNPMLMNKLAWEETQGFFRGICYGNHNFEWYFFTDESDLCDKITYLFSRILLWYFKKNGIMIYNSCSALMQNGSEIFRRVYNFTKDCQSIPCKMKGQEKENWHRRKCGSGMGSCAVDTASCENGSDTKCQG